MALRTGFDNIHERIARAAESVGRDPSSVTLIAVTKTVDIALIREAYDLGHRDFGESRLQEALPKIELLPPDVRWHFIGKLQSNKAKRAGDVFQVIHTLESEQQLRELSKAGREVDGLIEVNSGGEEQKSGISSDSLVEFAKTVVQYPLVRLRGLMTVGPLHPNAEFMRPFFRELRELGQGFEGQWLSMGMSNDFEVAIQEGSTHVRVGSALFGARS